MHLLLWQRCMATGLHRPAGGGPCIAHRIILCARSCSQPPNRFGRLATLTSTYAWLLSKLMWRVLRTMASSGTMQHCSSVGSLPRGVARASCPGASRSASPPARGSADINTAMSWRVLPMKSSSWRTASCNDNSVDCPGDHASVGCAVLSQTPSTLSCNFRGMLRKSPLQSWALLLV